MDFPNAMSQTKSTTKEFQQMTHYKTTESIPKNTRAQHGDVTNNNKQRKNTVP